MQTHSNILFGTVAPQFLVPDITATVHYYRDKLGFKISDISGDPPQNAIVTRGNSQIFFAGPHPGGGRSNRRSHTTGFDAYFRVHGLDELQQSLQKNGANILQGPELRPYGVREILIEDLNGFVLVFGEVQA
jgi:predicted enzyme related to lactoylglutathione lyase